MKKILSILSFVGLLAAVSCEKLTIADTTVYAPKVTAFTPASAPVGAEVIVEGENLQNVTKAFIGTTPVTIMEKVSNTRLSIRVTEGVSSGRVRLENSAGTGESSSDFTASYAVPTINAGILQANAEMGAEMLVCGSNMNSVISVLFTAEGFARSHMATIVTRNNEEIVVRVPYVEDSKAAITLSYYDGTNMVETPLAAAPKVSITRYVPVFNAYTFERTNVGRSISLTGEHLDKVDKIIVKHIDGETVLGTFEANVSKTESTLSFTIPEGTGEGKFADGLNSASVEAEYFDGNETLVLTPGFQVYVPFVKFWENITTSGHGKAGMNASFFSPETGIAYANADWREKVDPMSFKNTANNCSAAQTPKITEAEYNSVNPYFFMYCNNSNAIAFTSPANSAGLLKNFWIGNVSGDANRLPGANGNCYGTPVLGFRALSEANAAEKEIIDMVRAETLEKIDEATFPIDPVAKTIRGVSVEAPSGSLTDANWAKDVIAPKTQDGVFNMDAVVMVMYFDYRGCPSGSTDKLSNIKRLGFVNMKKVNFKIDQSNSALPGSLSEYTFNCYWQKYDYDYSKLK